MEENKEIRQAWDFVEHTGVSIFLTGKAGTGKTTFLRTVVEQSSKRMIVVAPTGVAAINAGGMTIHSFFQLPLSPYVPGTSITDRYKFSKVKRRIIRTLDVLVIDEISMVRSDLLDAIDFVMRRYRDHTRPFGGVQLLMIGDLQQLTPVVTPQDEGLLHAHYDTPYFFGSKALQQINYVTIQLTHVFRQQDRMFVNLLNHVREGCPTPADIALLNERCKPEFSPRAEEGYIRLTTHNRLADSYNEGELRKLKDKKHVYRAEITGNFPEYSYPTDVELVLKVGAQVMFVKNDAGGSHRYYNGRIGHVVSLDEAAVEVQCAGDEQPIVVEPQEWENLKYVINEKSKVIETQVQGVFRQYPLRLAWAITIHKSQGLTFERAIIDAGRSFASGQVYVALSRCKSLEGLVLASPIAPAGIFNDMRVANYISRQQEAAAQSISQLSGLKEEYFRLQLLDLFDFSALMGAEQMVNRTLQEYFRGVDALTNLHGLTMEALKKEVVEVSRKWQGVIRATSVEELHDEEFLDRVRRGAGYFLEALEGNMAKVLRLTREAKSQNSRGAELMEERYAELQQAYLAKNRLLRRMEEETFDVPTYLLAKHESMLEAMEMVRSGESRPRPIRKKKSERLPSSQAAPAPGHPEQKKRQRPAGTTYDISYKMLLEGHTPEDIARQRKLTIGTIYGHLARYVSTGRLAADKIIDAAKVEAIRHAIGRLPEGATMSRVKEACPADVTWNEIRLLMHDKE